MTILITGSASPTGKALFDKFTQIYPEEVVIGTVRTPSSLKNRFNCDLGNSSSIDAILEEFKPRLILHTAASYTNDLQKDALINVFSAEKIFKSILKQGIQCRVLVFGSAAEYGDLVDGDIPIKESNPLNPISIYGLTKMMQTKVCELYFRKYGVEVIVARVFNLMGDNLPERLFYGNLTGQLCGEKFKASNSLFFGDLSGVRDYLTIDEAVNKILLLSTHGEPGEVYNIGSGIPVEMRELLYREILKRGYDLSKVKIFESGAGAGVKKIFANVEKFNSLTIT